MKILRVFLAAALLPCAASFANEIRNGEFVDGLKGWNLQRDGYPTLGSKDALPFCRFEDDGVIIESANIESKREKPASLILLQYLKNMKEGVSYTLSFDVKIPAGETVTIGLGIPVEEGPNRGNLSGGVALKEIAGSGQWMAHTLTFPWDPSEAVAQGSTEQPSVQFRIGLVKEFGIRNVRLEAHE